MNQSLGKLKSGFSRRVNPGEPSPALAAAGGHLSVVCSTRTAFFGRKEWRKKGHEKQQQPRTIEEVRAKGNREEPSKDTPADNPAIQQIGSQPHHATDKEIRAHTDRNRCATSRTHSCASNFSLYCGTHPKEPKCKQPPKTLEGQAPVRRPNITPTPTGRF